MSLNVNEIVRLKIKLIHSVTVQHVSRYTMEDETQNSNNDLLDCIINYCFMKRNPFYIWIFNELIFVWHKVIKLVW